MHLLYERWGSRMGTRGPKKTHAGDGCSRVAQSALLALARSALEAFERMVLRLRLEAGKACREKRRDQGYRLVRREGAWRW